MKIDFKKLILPHFIAFAIFLAAASVYNIYELQGEKLTSHDSNSAVASSKEYREYKEKGEQILWSSKIFSGTPLFQIAYNPKGNLIKNLEVYRKVMPNTISIILTLMLGFYIGLVLFGIERRVAILGALVFGFSTWFLLSLEASHNTKVMAIAYVAPLLGSIYFAYQRKIWLGAFFVALFTSLAIGANHYQITYYSLFFIFFLAIVLLVDFVKNKNLASFFKRSLIIVVFAIFGVLTNLTVLWTTFSYASESTRGGKSELVNTNQEEKTGGLDLDYAMRWSYGKAESFNLLVPGLFGSGYQLDENSNTGKALAKGGITKRQVRDYLKGVPMYHGTQPFTSGPTYFGIISVFLFLLLFTNEKRMIKWALLATLVSSLFFAWGSNFASLNTFFFENFPLFNKFRAPSMWLSMGIISVSIGSILSLNNIIQSKRNKEVFDKKIFYLGGALAALIAGIMLFGPSMFDFNGAYDEQLKSGGFPIEEIIKDRKALIFSDGMRVLVLLGISLALIWAFMSNKLKQVNTFLIVIGLLMVGDMWTVGKRYFNDADYTKAKTLDSLIKPSSADIQILKDKGYFRVFNTTISSFNDNETSFYHNSVGGYSAAKLFRYQDLIENQLSKGNMNVFNMLNTKYFISGKPGAEVVQQNPQANGPVWLVREINWAKDANEEMSKLTDFDSKNTVIIDERFRAIVGELSSFSNTGTIEMTNFHPDKMDYTSKTSAESFAVFSETWYKGNEDWKAFIDGVETEFVRVNYLQRGLKIPAGDHKIEFVYHPESHYTGVLISRVMSVFILLLGLFVLYKEFKSKKQEVISA